MRVDYNIPQIRRWAEQGKTLQQISDLVGVLRGQIHYICMKHGITLQPSLRTSEKNHDRIAAWVRDGRTHQWVSDQLGLAQTSVSHYCKNHNIKCLPKVGSRNSQWKGGRRRHKAGYVEVSMPPAGIGPSGHYDSKYVLEHRLVMENHLGRKLRKDEVVHHKNGKKADNRIENLELYSSNALHLAKELKGRCPNWTKAGKEKLLELARRRSGIRKR